MGLDALLATLERDADLEVKRRLDAAQTEADRIREAGAARAVAMVTERRREVALEHVKRQATAMAGAVRAARARELESQGALLDQVQTRARAALSALPPDAWRPALPALVRAGFRYAGPGPVEVRCQPAVAEAVREAAAGREELRVVADPDLPAGLEVRRADGTMRVRLTLPDRLEVLWPALRLTVLDAVGAP